MLIFLPYTAVLKFLTYYAQYYAHLKNCAENLTVLLEYIHLYQKLFNMVSVLLEYIKFIISMVSVLLEYIDLH